MTSTRLVFIVLFSVISISFMFPQKSDMLLDNGFSFSVKMENDFVTISKIANCRFASIGFRLLVNGRPIGFNESGMFDLNKPPKPIESAIPFSFSVNRDKEGLILKAINGVKWDTIILKFDKEDSNIIYQVDEIGFKPLEF